ncbi:VOC family protein [Oceanibacterium hippocampi]|uniref:27 kDa antigen Cfp30B n=1 Tax=Oceanibacterium hippocampi TaxID=745714 RepID=A0A1Y5U135_9PROT|nr:VOC family protein [Oceanibacterium hippocampi]SLN75966.1 27 kDa antigen Cfp30B [Oceanibacterium hippocampi]
MSSEPMMTHGAPSWIEHHAKDGAAARAFYEKVLGWKIAELPMQDGATYYGIMVGEHPIGGFSPMPADRGSWVSYITVDDVDARFKKAVAAGAKPLMEPFSVPGVGRMAHFADPAGAVLALITYESQSA